MINQAELPISNEARMCTGIYSILMLISEVCMDWILDQIRTLTASNRISNEVSFTVAGAGLDLDLCLLQKRYWLFA